tara:strand:+ start:36301 stop:36732 length:432 start_codon:yes stop_codon:yes gene_type:complete
MRPDYHVFFATYVDSYNQALTGKLDTDLIRSFFADKFLSAGPETVSTGKNGFLFSMLLKKGYAFYKKMGARHLRIKKLAVTAIDYFHDMVKIQYNAEYVKKSGEPFSMDFEVTYFVQHPDDVPKIFGFVAGDEMRMYKEAGLI